MKNRAQPTKNGIKNSALSRRIFLRGAGVGVAVPFLSAMQPAVGAEKERSPKRFMAICAGLGFHTPFLFPEETGSQYPLTPYLERLKTHRDDLTLFSGLSHPEQNGNNGHASGMTWLTSARRPGLAGFKNTVSIDQVIANHLAGKTRLPFLCLSTGGQSLSWTSSGVSIPADSSPAKLFKKLFVDGTEKEIDEQVRQLDQGGSILDAIRDDARRVEQRLGKKDQQKLHQYYDSIRALENRMEQSKVWARRPKPKVGVELPKDVTDKQDYIAKQRLIYDMVALAFQTDSSRVVTLSLPGANAVPSNLPGVNTDWHNLSHHGKDPDKIAELKLIEEAEFQVFGEFLTKLKEVREDEQHLLDRTAIVFGSNLGNASAHDWHNLPILVAGGGYRHGSYVAHDADNNTPLANLFVAMAQRMEVPIDAFGSSTSTTIEGLS